MRIKLRCLWYYDMLFRLFSSQCHTIRCFQHSPTKFEAKAWNKGEIFPSTYVEYTRSESVGTLIWTNRLYSLSPSSPKVTPRYRGMKAMLKPFNADTHREQTLDYDPFSWCGITVLRTCSEPFQSATISIQSTSSLMDLDPKTDEFPHQEQWGSWKGALFE